MRVELVPLNRAKITLKYNLPGPAWKAIRSLYGAARRVRHLAGGVRRAGAGQADGFSSADIPGLIRESKLHETVFRLAEKAAAQNDRSALAAMLSQLDGRAIDPSLLEGTDRYIRFLHPGKRIVASLLHDRVPRPDEFVIIFGNYTPGFGGLGVNNPIRRNILEFAKFSVDAVESADCWKPISRIFVINRDDRPDRFYSALRELGRMGAPLDRITRFSARTSSVTADRRLNAYVGCLMSHLTVLRLAEHQGCENILVLEDDFGFTDEIAAHQSALSQFFDREYSFDICLLSTSGGGLIAPKDDLVSLTRQPCTNASAYIVSREGRPKLMECWSKALDKLVRTHDIDRFATDRSWAQLQGEKFLVFRNRMGFQLPSYSDIEGKMVAYFE
jgi:hypothetical protein